MVDYQKWIAFLTDPAVSPNCVNCVPIVVKKKFVSPSFFICFKFINTISLHRITVSGIFRAQPVRLNAHANNVNSVYRTHIDVIHFRKTDKKRIHERHSDR